MRKAVFGQQVTAIDVEHLRADTGPTDFVRLCGALIGKALADRGASFTLPEISERITVPDGGVDAEFTTPSALSVPETGGLIGPGRTVYQFKYRDARTASRSAILQKIVQQLRKDFPRVAPRCDRYALLTNIHLSGAQPRRFRDALAESYPAFSSKPIVIWGAAEIALALNLVPPLRHLFFSEGGLSTLDVAEAELKGTYDKIGWPPFINRDQELAAIEAFVKDGAARFLKIVGPKYVGKTRLVLEALKSHRASVLWAASPDDVTLDLFRDLDSSDSPIILVVDRCDEGSVSNKIREWVQERHRLKTIMIRAISELLESRGEKETLFVPPFGNQEARKLLEPVIPGLPFAQESWMIEAGGGLPGLLLHVAALTKEARITTSLSPQEIQTRLGSFLEEQYLFGLSPEARQALEAASLLPVLGFEGEAEKEIEAACRALDLPPGVMKTHLRMLQHKGLVRRRGRFIEVVPPRLAEHLASRALTHPERILAELQIVLEPGAFLRFLERFRDLPGEGVRSAIAGVFAAGGWFDDLDALIRNARKLEILAPAVPIAALRCIERLLENLPVEELKTRVVNDARRALVWALEGLALRSETFEGATRQLLAFAGAENEKWANNAPSVFRSLFHWQHPQVTVPLSRRLGVLQGGARSESALRRKVVAAACGEAFRENVVVGLPHPRGSGFPEEPYRAETWDEVGTYASGVLDLLTPLCHDSDPDVSRTAISSLRKCFWPFVNVSLRLPAARNGLPHLGERAFELLGRLARATQSARVRADLVSRLELVIERLEKVAANDSPAANQALRLASTLVKELTSTLQDRLWQWIGPRSWRLRRHLNGVKESAGIQDIASELLRTPQLFAQHLNWLTGEEAAQRAWLFQILGQEDKRGELFTLLLSRPNQSYWPDAFSAYIAGWFSRDAEGANAALDSLVESRADLTAGVVRATCALPPTSRAIERLLRLLARSGESGPEMVAQIATFMQWATLDPKDAERLISVLDDGTSIARSLLLRAFAARVFRGGEMSTSLRELAWSFLDSVFPVQADMAGHDWEVLAAELGKQEPQRLRHLLERLATIHPQSDWEHELPLVWETLEQRDRHGLLQMLLRLAMNADVPYWIDWKLSQMIDPFRDREVLLQFAQKAGAEGARAIALNLETDKPGFWELARDLIASWGDDDRVRERLLRGVMSGSWSESAIPMINARIDQATVLLKDPDPGVATWAQEVVTSLEEWRRRADREDQEEWIWDYRIRRSELEAMARQKDSPERLWAIGRLLKDAPRERVVELLTPADILEALPNTDEPTRRKWEGWARHWNESH